MPREVGEGEFGVSFLDACCALRPGQSPLPDLPRLLGAAEPAGAVQSIRR